MVKDKDVNRGGTYGQEGEISGPRPESAEKLDKRDQQKQQGGVGREPNLEEKHKRQPTHVVD